MSEVGIEYPAIDPEEERDQARLIALLFADWASATLDGKAAIGGVFDKIRLQPDRLPDATFYVYMRVAETYSAVLRLVLHAPDGQPRGEMTLDPQTLQPTPGEPNFVQFVSRLTFHLPETGVWWFSVAYGDRTLGRVPLFVERAGKADGDSNEGSI